MLTNLRTHIDRRMALLALLLLGIAGSGLISLATITDTLNLTNQIDVLSVELAASRDGVAYTASLTKPVHLEGSNPIAAIFRLQNIGNGESTVTWSTSATGSADITSSDYALWMVAAPADCDTTPVGTKISGGTATVGAGANNAVLVTMAPGSTQLLCEVFSPPAPPASASTATQTVVFTATPTLTGTQ